MSDHSAVGRRRCAVVFVAVLAVIGMGVAQASEPIVGPPIDKQTAWAVTAAPRVPVPDETPCVVTLFTKDSPTGTFDDYSVHHFDYKPPAACPGPWNKVVLKASFNVTKGRQYDRTGSVWIGGVNVFFGTTQEPSDTRNPSWSVERDVTRLSALFRKAHPGDVFLGNIYNSTYDGLITGTVALYFYPATPEHPATRQPDMVLPVQPASADPAGQVNYVYTDAEPLSRTFTFPQNIDRAYVSVLAQPQSGDEFWYSCGPDEHVDVTGCGGTAFREAEVSIDGTLAGIVPISGWIYSGGIDPALWRPITGIQTFNLRPYLVDITPFAGLLDNGQPHTVSIKVVTGDPAFKNDSQYFAVAATLLLYRNPHVDKLTGGLLESDDSGVHPRQHSRVAADGSRHEFRVTSYHRLKTRGYVETPKGYRAYDTVIQNTWFRNHQHIASTDTTSRYDIYHHSSALQWSYGNPLEGPDFAKTRWSFPLEMRIDGDTASDGTSSNTISVKQHFTLNKQALGRSGLHASNIEQADVTSDVIHYDAKGNYSGRTPHSSQSYHVRNSEGQCYSRTVKAEAGNVTQVLDGLACHGSPWNGPRH